MTTKNYWKLIFIPLLLLLLTACSIFQKQPSVTQETKASMINMPNPASAFCTENGNKSEIRNAADGSQSGACVFADGSSCDEWAYYRGECGPGVESDPSIAITVEATKDGIDATDLDASGGYMLPGASEPIVDWWGVIKSTPAGNQYDDYFERQDLGQAIYFGIDSLDPMVKSKIEALRDSGKIVHLYGTLYSNIADYNGSLIMVDRIEVDN